MADTTATFTTEDLLRLLTRSGLFNAKLLDAQKQKYQDGELEPAEILAEMLRESLLTAFQAKQLGERRHRGFFLSEKYKILEVLGQGGMSRVLLCEHLLLQRLVAVKILHKSLDKFPGSAERFLREARAAASMDHPNIARVFDVEQTSLGPSIVMEYVDGVNLHELATKRGPLSVTRVAQFISQAATGLHQAHLAGLVHRDIKPANLMLDRTGMVKLLDLGLARYFDPDRSDNLTQQIDASCVIGTADYIAPEQVMESSSADIRSDIYSLGYTMYFLLTRVLPAGSGAALRKLLWHQTREPEPVQSLRPDVPAELAAVLERMIQKKPELRYQTPAEVIEALRPWTQSPVELPLPEEMPKTPAAAYRLGLCPPPDRSRFLNESAPAAERPSAEISTVRSKSSSKDTAEASAVPASEIGYPPSSTVDPLQTTSSTIRSAGTKEILSLATETDATNLHAAANWREPKRLADAIGLSGRIDHRTVMISILITAAFVLGAGVGRWLIPHVDRTRTASTGIAPQTLPASADGEILQTSFSQPAKGIVVRGGGSTFIRPALERWSAQYGARTGLKIEYSAVGSGKGVDGLLSNFLDFACTEAPMTDEQLAASGTEYTHVPLALGAVVPAYNVPSNADEPPLRFTGVILANIFLGRIKKWNDPALTATNPGRQLPDLDITVVHRGDASGSTALWTEYLSRISSQWEHQVGRGLTVNWPLGTAIEKSDGIADRLSRLEGAIGYVELTHARANGLQVGQVKNASGEFIEPSGDSMTAAASALREIPADFRFSVIDASGPKSYPIVGTCWAIVRTDGPTDRVQALRDFLRWVITEGQHEIQHLNYGRLPATLSDRIEETLAKTR